MNFEKLTIEHDEQLVKSVSFKLIASNRHNAINGSFVFAEDINEFQISNRIVSRKLNGRYWQLYNVSINGCHLLDNSMGKRNPIFDVVMKEVRKSIRNLPNRCPMKKVGLQYKMYIYFFDLFFSS